MLDLPIRPTALMAGNSKLLLGVLPAVEEQNLLIPRDLSVLGVDDHLWNEHFNPTLTAVAQSTLEIGRKAFELLRQLILQPGKEMPPDSCAFPSRTASEKLNHRATRLTHPF